MPQQQKKKAKGIPKRATTNRGRCAKFFSYEGVHRRNERRLAHILKNNGPKEAKKWAQKHDAMDILKKLANNKSEFGDRSKIAWLASEALGK